MPVLDGVVQTLFPSKDILSKEHLTGKSTVKIHWTVDIRCPQIRLMRECAPYFLLHYYFLTRSLQMCLSFQANLSYNLAQFYTHL